MIKILISKQSTPKVRKFLIPKTQKAGINDWVEICVDYNNNIFTAKKIKANIISDEWDEYRDYTFPSSLLNEFLNNDSG